MYPVYVRWTKGWCTSQVNFIVLPRMAHTLKLIREFPSRLTGNETDQYPWGCGFHPWPHSVGRGSGVAVSCGVGGRCSSDPAWLWLWLRLAAAAPIWFLAWELPYAVDAALKRKKEKKSCLLYLVPTRWVFPNFWMLFFPDWCFSFPLTNLIRLWIQLSL